MPSPFDAAMAAADTVIGGIFGEGILVTPLRSADGELKARSADPTRIAIVVTGVFTLHGGEDRLGGARQGTELQGMTTLAVAPAQVWFSAEQLDALGYVPVAGDLITRVEQRGRPSYAIAKPLPTDLGDVTFLLTKEVQR